MRQHQLKPYTDDHKRGEYCEACCAEGVELPSECPGRRIEPERRKEIAEGKTDYVNGRWILSDKTKGDKIEE